MPSGNLAAWTFEVTSQRHRMFLTASYQSPWETDHHHAAVEGRFHMETDGSVLFSKNVTFWSPPKLLYLKSVLKISPPQLGKYWCYVFRLYKDMILFKYCRKFFILLKKIFKYKLRVGNLLGNASVSYLYKDNGLKSNSGTEITKFKKYKWWIITKTFLVHSTWEQWYILPLEDIRNKSRLKSSIIALASVAQLVGRLTAKQKVTGLIPSQGKCLGCRFSPRSGWVHEAIANVFLPSFPSL